MQDKLDKKSKIIFVVLLVLIIISVSATYYRAFVTKDFEVFFDDYGEGEELLEETILEEEIVTEEVSDEEDVVEEEI